MEASMTAEAKPTSTGLEGISAADTVLSLVDGERGRLVLRGFEVEDLSERDVEDVAALLWQGRLPEATDRATMQAALARGRVAAFRRLERLGDALAGGDGMDALRASLAQLPSRADDGSAGDSEGSLLAGAAAVFAAAWWRKTSGQPPVPPDPSISHAADYLRMTLGQRGSPAAERALATYLVTVADHGMSASTFAARVVASTGSDAVSAVVAAVGALKGPLHGGAPGPVLDMLDAVGSPESAERWIEGELKAGRRIMGMGHRVYRVRD